MHANKNKNRCLDYYYYYYYYFRNNVDCFRIPYFLSFKTKCVRVLYKYDVTLFLDIMFYDFI